jgi:hypothetical protein
MLAMPSPAAVLELWETGEREHVVDRALTLLEAFTGEPRASIASLGVHRRDALLAESRVLAFGPLLQGVARCSHCGNDVEVEFRLQPPRNDLPESGSLTINGDHVTFRAPNSYDLAAVAVAPDPAAAVALLRSRCIDGALRDDGFEAVDKALEELCAPATIELAALCPACHARFDPLVDIGAILWRELAAYARRLLDDVDALATKYGWSEPQILALSDVRRQRYIEGEW